MSIWRRIFGGWKTHGPGTLGMTAGFDSHDSSQAYDPVDADTALKLSAVYSCVSLRAEVIGSLPVHVRDAKKNVVRDHPAYAILHDSPNAMMTPAEWLSMQQAHVDMQGNGVSIVTRRSNGTPISCEPVDPESVDLTTTKSGRYKYKIGNDNYDPEEILHLKSFSMDGLRGLPRLDIGSCILSSQVSANSAAARFFRNGLKIGGFFVPEISNPTPEQLLEFNTRLDRFGLPENAGKWLTLLKGFKPVSGAEFRIKPAEAELMQSRYFGIEEICRLFNTPPQLIGHSDKSSSWASSLENINLFFLMYSLQPSFIRHEQRFNKTLLSAADRAQGLHCKFNLQGLLRADAKVQAMMFSTGLQNGYYSINDVRDLLDRAGIGEEGDEYRVQMNMAPAGAELEESTGDKK
jgi:HK97 family phage portal protein